MKNIYYIEDFQAWSEQFHFKNPIKVRFSETDMFGHVNNTKVFIYFEEARIEFLKSIGLMEDWMASSSDTIPVTADLQCNYIRQMYFGQRLNVFVKIATIGTTSIDLHYMIKNEQDEVCATGRGRMVQVGRKAGKPCEWSEKMAEKLKCSIK